MNEPIKIAPSAMPYLAECPCFAFKPGPPGPNAIRGSNMDRYIRLLLEGNDPAPFTYGLKAQDEEPARWTVETIADICGGRDVVSKKSLCKLPFVLEGAAVNGECDAYTTDGSSCIIFDFKTGRVRDYRMQMIAYCLGAMRKFNLAQCTAYPVFCDHKVVQSYTVGLEEAQATIGVLVLSVLNPHKKPTPTDHACEFCKYKTDSGLCSITIQ